MNPAGVVRHFRRDKALKKGDRTSLFARHTYAFDYFESRPLNRGESFKVIRLPIGFTALTPRGGWQKEATPTPP
jgi:hypothetical protein